MNELDAAAAPLIDYHLVHRVQQALSLKFGAANALSRAVVSLLGEKSGKGTIEKGTASSTTVVEEESQGLRNRKAAGVSSKGEVPQERKPTKQVIASTTE